MNRAELIASLEAEGLTVTEWFDEAGTHYDEHVHPRDEVLAVLEGTMTMLIGGDEHALGPGDRIRLGAGEKHTATVGEQGVRYLVAKT